MARGRMLNKSVSLSLKLDQLPDDTCRLLATWIIPQLDFQGVFYADPAIVKSMVFPRRIDVSVEQVAICLEAMSRVGLIVIFEAKGQPWQWWPGFADNQVGLRADRESTDFPPAPDVIPQDDGNLPEGIPQDDGKESAEHEVEVESKDAPTGSSEPSKKSQTPAQVMFTTLADLCQIDWRVCDEKQRGALNQTEKRLRVNARASPDNLIEFGKWWYACDWRGKKGEAPAPAQVRETWGKFTEWHNGSKPKELQGQPIEPVFLED